MSVFFAFVDGAWYSTVLEEASTDEAGGAGWGMSVLLTIRVWEQVMNTANNRNLWGGHFRIWEMGLLSGVNK